MTFVSYAQNFEDVMLWRALRGVTCGFYIDVGAAHPDIDSVTRAFYDRGWSGINVEPTDEYFVRLSASRPRDVNLQIVLGDRAGNAKLLAVEGTGLSTLDTGAYADLAQAGAAVRQVECPMETLAALCRRFAPEAIHFLKIDVEGAERQVLAGADFVTFRPWIVLVEATAPMSTVETHGAWEPALLAAGYDFVWFDGLNRFYVAHEQSDALAASFETPPNVFDDFVRAADSELARRIGDSQQVIAGLSSRAREAEAQAGAAEARAGAIEARMRAAMEAAARLEADTAARMTESARLATHLREALDSERRRNAAMDAWAALATTRARAGEEQRDAALGWLDAALGSTSWRVTTPLRRLRSRTDVSRPHFPDLPVLPALPEPTAIAVLPDAPPPPLPPPPRPVRGLHLRSVHQFHAGSASGDAITNAMLMTRGVLRSLGFRSEIFVQNRDPGLAHELRLYHELPSHDRYVLIVRHSMGYDDFAHVASLPAPKILLYHNITPPELLTESPVLQRYAKLGREQLALWRGRVWAALADSEFNALELRALAFDPVRVCMLLFDVDSLLQRAVEARAEREEPVFTVLFVGRVCPSKRQRELVEAYAIFARRFARPARLVLVGRHGGDTDPYVRSILAQAADRGVEDSVTLTGLVDDDALHRHYATADLFVCLSEHEGFCVPLIEAAAHGVPVLARPTGAVPYTLGDPDGLLMRDSPDAIAARMLDVATDDVLRDRLARRQRATLESHRLGGQMPALLQVLAHAGAVPPAEPASIRALSTNMHFAVAGHVNGSYSLAVVNRTLALNLEARHAGRVRLLPVEGERRRCIAGIPTGLREDMERLVARPQPATGPEVLISQHYPVYVPSERSDLTAALFFWEESAVPDDTVAVLSENFDAVFAPSRFVARTLIDSGVSIPVRVIGFAPRLDAFRPLAAPRTEPAERPFTFLHVSSCFPRKGIDILLRAYARAFRREDAVRLVIKTFPNPHNDAASQLSRAREADEGLAEIVLIEHDMDEAALAALYGDADVMVLPTRGEGFNLPAAEALAAGLRLIVTGFGGHMDFCGGGSTRLIDYRFAPSRSHLSSPGSVWVEPDEDDLVAALREAPFFAGAPVSDHAGAPYVPPLADIAAGLLTASPREPIDIVWISSWDVRCGIAEYSRYLIEAMPPSPAIGSVTVLCDDRTDATGRTGLMQARPCWALHLPAGAADLAQAISVRDPAVVVIQHHPGLIGWAALASLLAHAALRERLVVVTLHTTRQLLDADAPARLAALAELTRVARVIVHTIDDRNRLKSFGLVDNVVLIPQGVPDGTPDIRAPRRLSAESSPLIGSYGFFLPDKGIPQLIDAFLLLREPFPRIRLRLVNAEYEIAESRAEIAVCRKQAEARGADDAIDWQTDFLPNEASLRLLTPCDLIVLPYQRSKEGSSAALRFALGARAPVLVTPLPLFDEADEAVVRAPALDGPALAAAARRLLADAAERARTQQAAADWMRQNAWPRIARRVQGMLLGLAASDARPW